MNHILKGIRSVFYSQNELEKRGWELTPLEQRKYELWVHGIIAGMFSVGICGVFLCSIFYFQTDSSFNPRISQICLRLAYVFGGMFLFGLIGTLTVKQ